MGNDRSVGAGVLLNALVMGALVLASCASQSMAPEPDEASAASATGAPSATADDSASPGQSAGRPVTFRTRDGATLSGLLYGTGGTLVVLSNMGDNDPGPWQRLTPALTERGYQVLTYSYRYPPDNPTFTRATARDTVADLDAAVAFARSRKPDGLVLVGASLGGMVTMKVAGRSAADAAVVLSAPIRLPAYGFAVTPHELAALRMPVLVLGSVSDDVVPFARVRQTRDAIPGAVDLVRYTGSQHGVELLAGPHGADLIGHLIDFLGRTAQAGSE